MEMIVIIKDGVKEPVIREYDDTIEIWNSEEEQRKRNMPGERDENSPKRLCLNPAFSKSRGSLILYDISNEYEYGTLRMKDMCYVIKRSGFENRIMEANLKTHSFRVCENNVWKENNAEEGCIDLDVNGKRWEGGVKDGKPFGWGVLYDGEGKKEYEGPGSDPGGCLEEDGGFEAACGEGVLSEGERWQGRENGGCVG